MDERKVTLRDVAELANVHPATASRALNADTRGLVKDGTARRVIEAAQALDYQPNPMARSLKTRRSHTVGVLIPDLTNPLFPPIVRGVEDRLAGAGYVALLGNTDNDEDRARLVFDRMRARHVDGFIVAIAHRSDALLLAAARADVPIVLVNRVVEGHAFASVSVDNRMGISMAISHLVGLGHRRIAHVAGPQDLSTGFDRYRGFQEGMAARGIEVDPDLVVFADAFSQDEGRRCGAGLLATRGFSAVVAANDMLALGIYQALDEAGLRCPEDVSVMGFNDMPFIDRLRPPLSSVRFPHYQVGMEAAQLMLERVKDRSAPVKVLYLAPELVVRGSTAPPPASATQSPRPPGRRARTVALRAVPPSRPAEAGSVDG
ncbi:MAG: LacI family DNA-binding transcriptional regulator [Acidimicrobiales bacterium]